jgi:hypothetical protein
MRKSGLLLILFLSLASMASGEGGPDLKPPIA